MKMLFEVRAEDIGPGDFVKIECPCGHVEILTARMLATAGVQPYEHLVDLPRRLRCRECDRRGTALVSIQWAEGTEQADRGTG